MSILVEEVAGRNVPVADVNSLVKNETHMVVFLRHLGCNLTLQLLKDVQALEAQYKVKFPIIYVSQGSKNYCDSFWKSKYPEARVVYDSNLSIAKRFGLKEGSVSQVINAKSIYCSIRAMSRGTLPGSFQGNVFMLPGVFVYVSGQEVFKHIADSAGDMPDFEDLVKKYLLDALQA